ncbi:hypothetical protein Sste5346_002894 [Sporothrix stenoceras]|uniref:CENP-V/GFA domain-containing protein n=1 Tax=Sporothrix stenoceras TaxID=5173 RepID=A0ABR3ZGG4_9PEZI
MSTTRVLHGGCHCGRNMYIVQPPPDAAEVARLLFDPAPSHRSSLASPLPTYLRVPLAWYHSTAQPFFPDETHSMIHRSYEHPGHTTSGTRRHFCGFCGTPLSFWSETPPSEADYIRLALGSLSTEDLDELDEWARAGDQSDNEEEEEEEKEAAAEQEREEAQRETLDTLDRITSSTGLPWFDSFVEGSRLSRHLLRQQKQQQQQQLQQQSQGLDGAHIRRHDVRAAKSADGTVQVEWEVLEWTEGDEDEDEDERGNKKPAPRSSEPSPAKRARLGEDEAEGRGMDVE